MTTMLDKVAVAGDITQALDRRGVLTCAITVIGGTESTAVKLQSCETASGSFTDFLTLIPASEASATQYKGFVVDLHGAGKFIKVTGATIATAVFGDCNYDVKKIAIKAGEVPSGADLEDNKTATIDVSAYTDPVEITPSEGKDGMKKATITLSNIPSPSSDYNFYSWKDENEKLWYTLTSTPQANDYAYPQYSTIYGTVCTDGIGTIVSVTDTTITFTIGGEETFTATRDSVSDILFLKESV